MILFINPDKARCLLPGEDEIHNPHKQYQIVLFRATSIIEKTTSYSTIVVTSVISIHCGQNSPLIGVGLVNRLILM